MLLLDGTFVRLIDDGWSSEKVRLDTALVSSQGRLGVNE